MATPSVNPDRPAIDQENARTAINRENAQHSTGPRTPEGKDRVRLNAYKHGIYAHNLILADADREAFEHAAKNLEARYRPQTEEESELVKTLLETSWRLDHAVANERNLHILTEQQQLENIDALFGDQDESARRALAQAAGLQANFRIFDQLSRHIARLHRLIDQTRRTLEFRITQRRPATATKTSEQSHPPSGQALPTTSQMPHFTGSLKDFKRKQWLRQQEKRNHPPSAV
jgi:hypothetical protein